MIKNSNLHRSSAKKTLSKSPDKKHITHIGKHISTVVKIPAETVAFTRSPCFFAVSLIISLETVMGIPEAEMVINTPTTDRAI